MRGEERGRVGVVKNFVVECRKQRQQPSSTHVFALATEAVLFIHVHIRAHVYFISYN